MSDAKLDLSVPESSPAGQKGGSHTLMVLAVLTILILTGVNTYVLFTKGHTGGTKVKELTGSRLSPEQEREYAQRLEEKGLYLQASAAWGNYLSSGGIENRHTILYRMGDCNLKAGKYEAALDYFYRAEQLDSNDELDAADKVEECLESIGSFSAIEKDLTERTSLDGRASDDPPLAQVGKEIITEADLKREIETQLDIQLSSMKGKVSAEQYTKQKTEMMNKYLDDPKMMERLLQGKVRSLLLFAESKKQNIKETAGEKSVLENFRRDLVGGRFLRKEVESQIRITESDFLTYFRANKDDYAEKPSVKIRLLTAENEEKADKLYARVKNDKSTFFGLTDSEPLNKKLDTWIPKGTPIPGIGGHRDLLKLYAPEVEKGDIIPPLKIKDVYYIIQAADKNKGRERTFEEVKTQVVRDLYQQKYSDTEQAVLNSLMKKYKVSINSEHFRKKDAPAE